MHLLYSYQKVTHIDLSDVTSIFKKSNVFSGKNFTAGYLTKVSAITALHHECRARVETFKVFASKL